jgi:hypothetical protein
MRWHCKARAFGTLIFLFQPSAWAQMPPGLAQSPRAQAPGFSDMRPDGGVGPASAPGGRRPATTMLPEGFGGSAIAQTALSSLDPKSDVLLINKNASALTIAFLDGSAWKQVLVPGNGIGLLRCTVTCGQSMTLEFNDSVEQKRYAAKIGSFYILASNGDRSRWVFMPDQ